MFLNRIPFIDNNDNSFSSFMGNSGDLCILLCDSFHRIDHH